MKHRLYVAADKDNQEHCVMVLSLKHDVPYDDFTIPAGTIGAFHLEGENGWPEFQYEGDWLDWADPISDYEVLFINTHGLIK